tara:strand:+ start:698 stop:1522 length:825 start_codon:yes stop_codon:yes gene_type:complete
MSYLPKKSSLIQQIVSVSKNAGAIILDIYKNYEDEFIVKEDSSPLTRADTESNKFIVEELKKITPDIPILSEEEKDIPFRVRSKWKKYWLIDPLDGTKEFIKKNGEFTVNIALIRNNRPIFGVIHIPDKQQTYWGVDGHGSFLVDKHQETVRIGVQAESNEKIRFLTSRSHSNDESLILDKLESYEVIRAGSSLKFCLIASGKADAYLRLGPTAEWDIAAGDAIVKFAGGVMVDLQNRNIVYNVSENLINPYFLVTNNNEIAKKILEILNSKDR